MKITYQAEKKILVCILAYTALIAILTLFQIPFSVYYFSAAAVLLFVCFLEYGQKSESRKKERELLALDWLLSELRHRYYVHGMVDEAMSEAYESCRDVKLKDTIHEMILVLTASDTKQAEDRFHQKMANRYYGMLLKLSIMVMEFGDKKMEGQSLYLTNLKSLRSELHIEIQQERSLRHYFMGLTFVILMPLLGVKLIESWGMENLEELSAYYRGTYQILFYISIFAITLGLYYLFYLFKSPIRIVMSSHEVLAWMTQHLCIEKIYENYEEYFDKKANRNRILLLEVGETLTGSMLLAKRLLFFVCTFFSIVLIGIWRFSMERIGAILMLAVVFGGIAYQIPLLLMYYRRKMMQMYMEEEVFQYQSILMMLMYMERISTYELLEAMEGFAVIFKQPLKACLTEYESGQIKALQHMKEKVRCQAMQGLLDNLIMCDEIGVEKALDELTLEKNFYNEKRKQQNDYNLERKGVLCKFLAFIPLAVTIAFYLILPFITVSITKLSEISSEISGSGR